MSLFAALPRPPMAKRRAGRGVLFQLAQIVPRLVKAFCEKRGAAPGRLPGCHVWVGSQGDRVAGSEVERGGWSVEGGSRAAEFHGNRIAFHGRNSGRAASARD